MIRVGDGCVAPEQNDPAKTIGGGEEMDLGSHETQGIGFESDPMETSQGDEEAGIGSPASKNNLREESSLTPLNLGRLHVQERVSPRYEKTKRSLVEVFSMQMIGRSCEFEHIGGVILLRGSGKNYVLHENPCDERGSHFISEGYLTLIGPESGVEVEGKLVMYPWLFHKISLDCDRSKGKTLWLWNPHSPRTDQVISKGFRSKIAFMLIKVDFAVYSDGVEARIKITLLGLGLEEGLLPSDTSREIYGTVKAWNNHFNQSKARSTLFNRPFSWPPGKAEISVPLTRNVTVIPRESSLIVDVDLSLRCTPLGESIAVGSVTFDPRSRSSLVVQEKTITGAHAIVKVEVTWST